MLLALPPPLRIWLILTIRERELSGARAGLDVPWTSGYTSG
jgi:hypothetical protein